MPASAARLITQRDRRDQMMLSMAIDAAHAKRSLREARHKRARQSIHRQVRYRRFQGRRDEAMGEDTRGGAYLVRLERSIETMATWLRAQAEANAEEGSPRTIPDADGLEDVPLSRLVAKAREVAPITVAPLVEGPINLGVPVVIATLAGETPLALGTATFVSAELPGSKGVPSGGGG
jgi:hypothetical protein